VSLLDGAGYANAFPLLSCQEMKYWCKCLSVMSKTKHMLARSDCSSLFPIALKPKWESFQEITKANAFQLEVMSDENIPLGQK
jgi:hypothetical protein